MAQTIYEWRGSEPGQVIRRFKQEFNPVTFTLNENYRATRILLNAAHSFASTFKQRHATARPSKSCDKGEPIRLFEAEDEEHEAQWIARQIARMSKRQSSFPYKRIAVLTRTNRRGVVVSGALRECRLPCVTVEQYEFFRRQEVKDAIALLRLLLNPHDISALHRILLRPPRGIGARTIDSILSKGEDCGLRLTDMVRPAAHETGDPLGRFLTSYESGATVVLDVESTGLSPARDEVIEISAARIERGTVKAAFHTLAANTVPVGSSVHIHGLTDEHLREQ
jgi:DNA helicase-2/ATP-dependent DNA helicase PcrA